MGSRHWFALVRRPVAGATAAPAAANKATPTSGGLTVTAGDAAYEWWNCDSMLSSPQGLGSDPASVAAFLAEQVWATEDGAAIARLSSEVLIVT
jgi:hypothetical protein